jgi:hypothetical protein
VVISYVLVIFKLSFMILAITTTYQWGLVSVISVKILLILAWNQLPIWGGQSLTNQMKGDIAPAPLRNSLEKCS